jgi:hypothetical protein
MLLLAAEAGYCALCVCCGYCAYSIILRPVYNELLAVRWRESSEDIFVEWSESSGHMGAIAA